MQLGIFAKIFSRSTVEEVFSAVAMHGLRCVQFNFACAGLARLPDEIELGIMDRILQITAAQEIGLAAVSGTFNMIHPSLAQRNQGLERLRVLISAGSYLGANVITLCSGTRDPEDMWRYHPENSSPEAWRDLTESLEEALEVAEVHDITLGIEPEISNVIDSAQKARRLLDEMKSPCLKVILDGANLIHSGELPRMKEILVEAFDLLGGDIVLAHAKELGREGHEGHLALGTGVLDWDLYLARLRQANFTGPLIMHGFDQRDAAQSTEFVRRKLATAACV